MARTQGVTDAPAAAPPRIGEIGPPGGLQKREAIVDAEVKIELIRSLMAASVRRIEATRTTGTRT